MRASTKIHCREKFPKHTAPRDGSMFRGWWLATDVTNASSRRVYFNLEIGEFIDSYGQKVEHFYAWSPLADGGA